MVVTQVAPQFRVIKYEREELQEEIGEEGVEGIILCFNG